MFQQTKKFLEEKIGGRRPAIGVVLGSGLGAFAGIALKGATLRQDMEENEALYGKKLENREIVTTGIAPPPPAAKLLALLNRYHARESD